MENINPFWVLIVGSLLLLVVSLSDSFITHNLILGDSKERLVKMLTYLSLGSLVGLTVNYVLCQTNLGHYIDPRFVSIGNISGNSLVMAILSGITGALATAAYLWAYNLDIDPSLVMPLRSLAVFYVVVAEAIKGTVQPLDMLLPVLLIVGGVFIGLFAGEKDKKKVYLAVVLILIVRNGLTAFGDFVSVDAINASDSVTFNFYRFLWLAIGAWTFSVLMMIYQRKIGLYIASLFKNVKNIPWIALVMVVVFFSNGLLGRGASETDATTLNIIMSAPILLSVVISGLVNLKWPGTFSPVENSTLRWILRGVGSLLLVFGVVLVKSLSSS